MQAGTAPNHHIIDLEDLAQGNYRADIVLVGVIQSTDINSDIDIAGILCPDFRLLGRFEECGRYDEGDIYNGRGRSNTLPRHTVGDEQ